MNKSELKHNMIVRSSGGRYGVVVVKDETNENVIKFFYDPFVLADNGYVKYGKIISLDEFDDDLVLRVWIDEYQDRVPCWNIEEVFELQSVFEREEEQK